MVDNAISVSDLSVSFGSFEALLDLTFEIKKGEIAIIIGPNGAGKSTLIRSILGLVPHKGTALILGKNPKEMNRKDWARVGYVPQTINLPKDFPFTVNELISYSQSKNLIPESERKFRIEKFSSLEHIKDLRHKLIGELSGGQMQRVLIARSLIFLPDVMFLDEPLAGIDIEGENTFYEFINNVRNEYGITFLLISHDVTVVSKLADKVLCLNKRLFCYGKPSEVLNEEKIRELYGDKVGVFKHKTCPQDGHCNLYKEVDK
ncbi:MAG: metal ABC transporter ATP-binding protein [Caldisericaceae bacterium]